MKKIIKSLFVENKWVVCYRCLSKDDENMSLEEYLTKQHKYEILKIKRGFWAADPFLFLLNDKYYVFYEYMNMKKNKAVIAMSSFQNNSFSGASICYEFDGHTSYPAIFKYCTHIYMIPETCYSNNIVLLKNVCWPNKWESAEIFGCGYCPDTTPFVFDNKIYTYVYEKQSNCYSLKIGVIENGKLNIIKNVASYEEGIGRPAGGIINDFGVTYRPTQYNKNYYGERIDFYRIDINNNFAEEKINSYTIDNVLLNIKMNIKGIHTFNRVGNMEVVDVLSSSFSLLKPIKKIFEKLNIFGFSNCDRRKKRIYEDQI